MISAILLAAILCLGMVLPYLPGRFDASAKHYFTSHALDILQYDGEQLDLRRGDRRRTRLAQPHWISILLD